MSSKSVEKKPDALLLIIALVSALLSSFSAAASYIALRNSSPRHVYSLLIERPEILISAIDKAERANDDRSQRIQNAALSSIGKQLYNNTERLGSPKGKHNIVEFIDYKCTFCKASLQQLEGIERDHPDTSIIIRQLPILSDISKVAAAYSYAAADQGKFRLVHADLLRSQLTSIADIKAVLTRNNVDLHRALAYISGPECRKHLKYDEESPIGLAYMQHRPLS